MGLWIAAACLASFLALALLAFATPRLGEPGQVAGAKFAAVDGGVIRYQLDGDGTHTLVFLHGFNQDLSSWDAVWAASESCPVRRLRVDIPGFGASRFDTNEYGLSIQAQRIASLLDTLHLQQVTLIGSSMGGSLAVWLAAQHPERVVQLGLLAPSGYPGSLRHDGAFGRVLQPGMLKRSATWLARTRIYKWLFPGSAALQALTTTNSYGPAWLEQLAHVHAPVFLAWSRSDRTAHAETADSVASALPNATLFWLDESAGHDIPSTRSALTAESACLLAQGMSPANIATQLAARAVRDARDAAAPAASRPSGH